MARVIIVDGRPSFAGANDSLPGGDAEQAFINATIGACNAKMCLAETSPQWRAVVAAWKAMSLKGQVDSQNRTTLGPTIDTLIRKRLHATWMVGMNSKASSDPAAPPSPPPPAETSTWVWIGVAVAVVAVGGGVYYAATR